MKAAQIDDYGDNSGIKITETAKPTLKEGQVLVEVQVASINPFDSAVRTGALQKMLPLPITLGGDFSGIITEVASGVTDFKVGDEVYGSAIVANGGSGSMAEFTAANVGNSALKPKSIDFVKAAAFPLVGVSALQALFEHMKLQERQKILIHGGAGGIGHIAIQLAKALGAYVATTADAGDTDFVKTLGVDEVIDYKTQKFEEVLAGFDAVYDTIGGEVTNKSFQVLKEGGVLVSMLGQPSQELANQHKVTAIGQATQVNTEHLNRLTKLIDEQKITVHTEKVFSLEQTKEAFECREKEHPRGKVVIVVKS